MKNLETEEKFRTGGPWTVDRAFSIMKTKINQRNAQINSG